MFFLKNNYVFFSVQTHVSPIMTDPIFAKLGAGPTQVVGPPVESPALVPGCARCLLRTETKTTFESPVIIRVYIYIHITFCLKKTWILAELFSVIHSNPMFVWSVSPRKSRQKQKEAVASPQLRCPTYWWRHTLWPQRYLDHGQAQLSQIRVPCIRTWGYHKKDQET